jgi:FkbM family methyltransferase
MNNLIDLNRHTIAITSICFKNRKLALLSSQARLRNIRIETGKLIEKYFFDICDNLSINLLVECGAHDAAISVKFCSKDNDRQAIGFEANPFVVARFGPYIKNENIKYLNIGLAEHPGTLTLNIPSHSPKSWTPQSSFARNLEFDKFDTVNVPVDNLDNLILKYNSELGTTCAAIWIDVEGFGWEVLNGAKSLLSSNLYKVIFIEVQDIAMCFLRNL